MGRKIQIFIAGMGLVVFYAFFVAPGVTGIADSDEFLGLAFGQGLAHPPGYPLYVILLRLGALLPGANIWLVQATSAALMAATVLILTLLLSQLMRLRWSESLLISLGLAINTLWWKYALIAEVMPMALLLMSVFLWWWFRLALGKTRARFKDWLLLGALAGLLINQHQMMVLVLPALVVWMMKVKVSVKALVLFSCGLLMGFLIPYLILVIQPTSSDLLGWQRPRALDEWTDFVLRADFSGVNIEEGLISNGYLLVPTLDDMTESAGYALGLLSTHTPLPFLILIVIGLGWGRNILPKHIRLSVVVLTVTFTVGLVYLLPLGGHANGAPDYMLVRRLTERFYLPSLLLLAIWGGVGWEVVRKRFRQVKWQRVLLLSLVLFYVGWTVLKAESMRAIGNTRLMETMQEALQEPDTIHICFEDVSCFALMALGQIKPEFADVIILSVAPQLGADWYEQNWRTVANVGYPDNPFRLLDIAYEAARRGRKVRFHNAPYLYQRMLGQMPCISNQECTYYELLRQTFLEPANVSARLELARFYEERGYLPLAKREYVIIQKWQPTEEIEAKLASLAIVENFALLP